MSNFRAVKGSYTESLVFYLKRWYSLIKKLRLWLRRYRLHMLIWAIFIAYECVMVGLVYGEFAPPLVYVMHYLIIISLFYTHAGLGVPRALENKLTAIWKLPLLILLELGAYLLCSYACDLVLAACHVLPAGSVHFTSPYATRNGYRALYFMGFSFGYYFLITYNKERIKTAELDRQRLKETISRQKAEQELYQSQNAFLKAQINPHFLFNTLDFIYHHIVSVSPVASEAVIVLSEMMRFAIDADKMGEFISLGDELDQVANLAHLNRLRKNEELPFQLIYTEEVRDIWLIPLVLLTLAENIFKHGYLDKNREACLEIIVKEDVLVITSVNTSNRSGLHGHGTGLLNIEKRLRYAYGDEAILHYDQDEQGIFRVSLQVPLALLQKMFPLYHFKQVLVDNSFVQALAIAKKTVDVHVYKISEESSLLLSRVAATDQFTKRPAVSNAQGCRPGLAFQFFKIMVDFFILCNAKALFAGKTVGHCLYK